MKNSILCYSLVALIFASAEEPPSQAKAAADMAVAANAFLASLTPEQSAKAVFDFADAERENWKFTPQPRRGVPIEALNDAQVELAKKLLASGLSDRGVTKATTIMQLEQLLGEMEKDPVKRNHKAYFTSIFGKPSDKGTWAWRFEGHHLAVNITVVDGKTIVAAPTFMGASPAKVMEGRMKGTQPLAVEEDLARALAVSLNSKGKKVIYTEQAPGDILTAEKRVAQQLEPQGIAADQFTESEQKLLIELVTEYAHRLRPAIAAVDLKKINALEKSAIRFAWAGSLEPGKAYYYRIQMPTVLIEAANSQNNANHIHTVWRDQKNEFGRDSLNEHFKKERH